MGSWYFLKIIIPFEKKLISQISTTLSWFKSQKLWGVTTLYQFGSWLNGANRSPTIQWLQEGRRFFLSLEQRGRQVVRVGSLLFHTIVQGPTLLLSMCHQVLNVFCILTCSLQVVKAAHHCCVCILATGKRADSEVAIVMFSITKTYLTAEDAGDGSL